ncbi:MAG: EAL domain-containing protein [Alphaproteobacteria bacterium]|nr:EAL domain-containing protein [Alphaproteobacteria bacterium]
MDLKRIFPPGAVLFREGTIGDTAYIVERGFLDVTVVRLGEVIRVATLGPGEIVGEMALIDDRPRSATVTATSETEVMVIRREQIQNRLRNADVITGALLRLTLNRFRTLQRTMAGHDQTTDNENDPLSHKAFGLDDPYERARERLILEQELREALESRQFFVQFQPVVALADHSLRGFEALIRWRHPERGLISPGRFVALAEEAGLIHAIDGWMARSALDGLYQIHESAMAAGNPKPWLSVNLSGTRFVDDTLVSTLRQVVQDSRIDPNFVTVEITEGVLIDSPTVAEPILRALKETGLTVALDDFGTGYSSLSYLQRFPIDVIKIDLTFIRRMMENETSLQIVRAIVGLAQALHIRVVAEGIETPDQAAMLLGLGCPMGQGYLFGHPLDLADAIAMASR